ncbi:hypothetical protein QQF64_017751 [Cirrhinus molitorella]|uniref:Uncharacterized protein n=1 Tax=Cirrhinus molitorella TaxID=172907 RepID=A0ABR3LJK3_9TELE
MLMFPHPWMLLRRLNRPGSARQARVALAVLRRSSSRPCQDDPHSLCERGQACHESDTMALILCADEVWRGRRSEFCLCSTEQISHALDTQRTRRCLAGGGEKEGQGGPVPGTSQSLYNRSPLGYLPLTPSTPQSGPHKDLQLGRFSTGGPLWRTEGGPTHVPELSQPSSPPPKVETPQEQQQMVVKGESGRALLLPRLPILVFLLSQQTPYHKPALGGLGSGSLSVGASCVVALLSGAAWALRVAVEPYQMVKRRRCREAPPIYEQTKAPASSPAPKLKDSKEGGGGGWC